MTRPPPNSPLSPHPPLLPPHHPPGGGKRKNCGPVPPGQIKKGGGGGVLGGLFFLGGGGMMLRWSLDCDYLLSLLLHTPLPSTSHPFIPHPPLHAPQTVRWKHNSDFVTSGVSGYVLHGVTDNSCDFQLRINAVQPSHAGIYRCTLAGDNPPSADRQLSIARELYVRLSVSVVQTELVKYTSLSRRQTVL